MPDLFNETELVQLADGKNVRLVIDGLETEDIWLVSIGGEVQPNFQILYSLGVKAFINAFGNRLGNFQLSGIYINPTCSDEGGEVPPFIKFYNEVQITKKKSTTMSFNGITIQGWATRMTIKNYSKQNIDGHEFTIQFLGRIRELEE
jgi:hypothetical protein